jgi:hypothetical protein
MGLGAKRFKVGALAALTLAAVTAAGSGSAALERSQAEENRVEQKSACGTPGLAPCPLQAFMRTRVAAQLSSSNLAALAGGLDRAAKLVPDPSWASWSAFARDGAAAARRGDVASARASCKECHDAWRDAYRARYRARPLPQ